MTGPNLEDKVLGCLLASALGNAMGSPVESRSYEEIESKYGRIETLLQPERLELEDDNRIGLLLCQTYIERGGPVTPEDLAKVWLREMDPKQFFWCLRNSYELLKAGVSPRVTGVHNVVTGSAIMAIAPVGIYNAGHPRRAYVDALQIGYMYQPRLDVECAGVIAACVAEAMKADSSWESVVETALEFATDEAITTFDERDLTIKGSVQKAIDLAEGYDDAFEARPEIYRELLQWHAIDPVEVLTLTLCVYKITKGDLFRSVVAGVNVGRDTDTIANLCGAMSGAMHGAGAIPTTWLDQANEGSVQRFRDVASAMTDLLLARASSDKAQAESILERAGR
jgi:ADP-ribosylglycohydrolase